MFSSNNGSNNGGSSAIQLNSYSTSIIQRDIQQREIVIVDTLFSLCGNYMVATNNIGCINVWKLEESLHPKPTNIRNGNGNSNKQPQQQNLVEGKTNGGNSYSDFYKPNCTFRAHPLYTPINKIHFINDQILASAGETDIKLWSWEMIKDFIELNLEKQQQYNNGGSGSSNIGSATNGHHDETAFIKIDGKSIILTSIESPRIEGHGGQLSEKSEINSIDSHGGDLYFASGNNNAYSFDLTKSQIISTFKGHTDYLHTIKYNSSFSNIITSSEDSTVRLWDPRSSNCVSILNPFYKVSFDLQNNNSEDKQQQQQQQQLQPDGTDLSSVYTNITPNSTVKSKYDSNFNQWCGPLDLDETGNWLAVGGSTLSLWYLGKLNTMVTQLPVDESTYSIVFNKEKIITCGGSGYVNYFALDGRPLMKVPSSSKILYSLSFNHQKRNQILIAGGTSPFINTFINQENIAFSYYFIANNED